MSAEHDGPVDGDAKDLKDDAKLPTYTVSRINLNVAPPAALLEGDGDDDDDDADADEEDEKEFSWRTLPRYVRRWLGQIWEWMRRNLSTTHLSISGAYLLYHLWQSWKESRALATTAATAAATAEKQVVMLPLSFVDRLNANIRWLFVTPLKSLVSFCKWLWNAKYDNLARAFMVLLLIVAFSLLPALESMVRRAVDRWLYGHDGMPPPPPKQQQAPAQGGDRDDEAGADSANDEDAENSEQDATTAAASSGAAAKQRGFVFE